MSPRPEEALDLSPLPPTPARGPTPAASFLGLGIRPQPLPQSLPGGTVGDLCLCLSECWPCPCFPAEMSCWPGAESREQTGGASSWQGWETPFSSSLFPAAPSCAHLGWGRAVMLGFAAGAGLSITAAFPPASFLVLHNVCGFLAGSPSSQGLGSLQA